MLYCGDLCGRGKKSVGSVPQSLSLGYAEPAPFTQGSKNKIPQCYKICFQKLAMISLSHRLRGNGASNTNCESINMC